MLVVLSLLCVGGAVLIGCEVHCVSVVHSLLCVGGAVIVMCLWYIP